MLWTLAKWGSLLPESQRLIKISMHLAIAATALFLERFRFLGF
jgi:hypothetical protein